jgi:glycosyltransferase involved in cell wall biosynthesis
MLIGAYETSIMTLGIFTDDFYPFVGGMGRYVHELTQRLPQRQILIFSPSGIEAPNHVRVRPLFHQKLRNLSFSVWLYQNIDWCIKEYDLSKINIQCGPGGLFLLQSVGVPVIATCHHTWWQQSRYIRKQFWKRLFTPFEKRTYTLANKIICDAEDSKSVLINKYGIRSKKIVVIPIGVDQKQFFPLNEVKSIPNSLLFIGRLDKRKGIDFLIQAMPYVVRENPGAKLYIGGTGKRQNRLQRYVTARNLDKNVEFLGFIPEERLNHWYNQVQCVVVPSVFEGFGLTVIEAMAAGTPVVATNVDALKDLIEDGVDGCLVEYGDIESLADRIVALLLDEDKRRLLAQKGREKVQSIYNWDRIIKVFIDEIDGASC